jgi:hypothetical protein
MAEATVLLRYLGQPATKIERRANPEWTRYQKIKTKAEKENGFSKLSFKEFQDLVKYVHREPDAEFTTGREIAQLDGNGEVIRNFPKDEKGNPLPKRALNGRATFLPANDYVASVTWDLASKLMKIASSGGLPLYEEMGAEVVDAKQKEIDELKELLKQATQGK